MQNINLHLAKKLPNKLKVATCTSIVSRSLESNHLDVIVQLFEVHETKKNY